MRLFGTCFLIFMGLIYRARGTLLPSDLIACAIFAAVCWAVIWFPLKLLGWLKRLLCGTTIGLSQPMFHWPTGDAFTESDMLRSVLVLGQTGSGKTSGPGLHFAKILAGLKGSGALILASKPEDRAFWERRMAEAGRSDDLLIFSETSDLRCNFLEFEGKKGDARSLTQFLMSIQEVLTQGGNNDRDPFWRSLNERIIYNAIVPILLAYGKVDAPSISKFINTAAYNTAELSEPKWKERYHNQTLQAAARKSKTSIQSHDFELSRDFWFAEFASMDDRPRSGGLLGVHNVLHVFNTGIVRELVSTTTNVSPASLEGKFIFVDFPPDTYGASGLVLLAGWKFLAQKYILRRIVTPDTPIICVTSDEAQCVINDFDTSFLNKCRGFRGCLLYLTQGLNNIYAAMDGHGHHKAEALIGQYGTVVANAVDPTTASWLSTRLGSMKQIKPTFNPEKNMDAMDILIGGNMVVGSFSEEIQPILEPREFMTGLRSGVEDNDFMVDAHIIRSHAFATGVNVIKHAFRQEKQ